MNANIEERCWMLDGGSRLEDVASLGTGWRMGNGGSWMMDLGDEEVDIL